MTEPQLPLVVVKVGGSLFDHPALGPGLRRWLAEQPSARYLFVPGGGALADCIRDYHRVHGINQHACHWMAIETMAINATLCRLLLGDCDEVDHPAAASAARPCVLNALHFCRKDESERDALPHDWRVTSDSIAARVAEVGKASRLMLLKSTDHPDAVDWPEAARREFVDAMFPQIMKRSDLEVSSIQFRALLDAFC